MVIAEAGAGKEAKGKFIALDAEEEYENVYAADELDLTKELKPIGHYVEDRVEMINQIFAVVKGPKLQAMLPPILKDMPLENLKALCLQELIDMPKSKIESILAGQDLESSLKDDKKHLLGEEFRSGSPSEMKPKLSSLKKEDSDQEMGYASRKTPLKKKSITIKRLSLPNDQELMEGAPELSDPEEEVEETMQKAKKSHKKKTESLLELPEKSELEDEDEDLDDDPKLAAIEKDLEGKTLMELLELEMRAKAIRKLLEKKGDKEIDLEEPSKDEESFEKPNLLNKQFRQRAVEEESEEEKEDRAERGRKKRGKGRRSRRKRPHTNEDAEEPLQEIELASEEIPSEDVRPPSAGSVSSEKKVEVEEDSSRIEQMEEGEELDGALDLTKDELEEERAALLLQLQADDECKMEEEDPEVDETLEHSHDNEEDPEGDVQDEVEEEKEAEERPASEEGELETDEELDELVRKKEEEERRLKEEDAKEAAMRRSPRRTPSHSPSPRRRRQSRSCSYSPRQSSGSPDSRRQRGSPRYSPSPRRRSWTRSRSPSPRFRSRSPRFRSRSPPSRSVTRSRSGTPLMDEREYTPSAQGRAPASKEGSRHAQEKARHGDKKPKADESPYRGWNTDEESLRKLEEALGEYEAKVQAEAPGQDEDDDDLETKDAEEELDTEALRGLDRDDKIKRYVAGFVDRMNVLENAVERMQVNLFKSVRGRGDEELRQNLDEVETRFDELRADIGKLNTKLQETLEEEFRRTSIEDPIILVFMEELDDIVKRTKKSGAAVTTVRRFYEAKKEEILEEDLKKEKAAQAAIDRQAAQAQAKVEEEVQEEEPVFEPPVRKKKDDDEDDLSQMSWSTRWVTSERVQKVVSTSKMFSKMRKKIKITQIAPTKQDSHEGTPVPEDAEAPQREEPSLPSVIGSIEEYERLFGKRVTALKEPEVPVIERKPGPSRIEVVLKDSLPGAHRQKTGDEDSDDDLWAAIMGND